MYSVTLKESVSLLLVSPTSQFTLDLKGHGKIVCELCYFKDRHHVVVRRSLFRFVSNLP